MLGKQSSKPSILWHDFWQVAQRNYGLLLLGLLVFSVLIPFSTAGMPGSSIFNVAYTHQQMKFRFLAADFVLPVNLAVVVYGCALGIALYRFVLDKKQTTVYFSLGLNRKKLFGVRYLAGSLMLLLGIGIPLLVSLSLNLIALGNYEGLLPCFFFILAGLFLTGLVCFTLSAIACCLAGTLMEAVIFNGALLLLPTILCYGLNLLMKHLLWGNAFGVTAYSGTAAFYPNLVEQLSFLNPVLFFLLDLGSYSMFYRSMAEAAPPAVSFPLLLGWAAAWLVFMGIALFTLKKRKAEQAGITGFNAWLDQVAVFSCGFFIFVLVFNFVAKYSVGLAYSLALAAFLLVYLLWRLVLQRQASRVTRIMALAGQLALLVFIVGSVATGGWGYTTRLPRAGDVTAATISYVGSPNYLSGETSGSSSGKGYYVMSDYTFTDTEDIETILGLHQALIQQGKQPLAAVEGDFEQTVVPYDIKIRYQKKDGTTLLRYYDRASLEQLKAMLVLDDTPKIKTDIRQTVTGTLPDTGYPHWAQNAFANGQVYLADRWYSNPYQVKFPSAKRRQLLEALAADLEQQTVAERYFPTEAPVGVMMFSLDGENDSKTFAYHLENTLVYIMPSFQHTLQFLEENNLQSLLEFKGEIESVTLQKYDPYGGINKRKEPVSNYFLGYRADIPDAFMVQEDFGKKRPVTDKNKLAQLTPVLQNAYFMSEEGYLAAVKVKGSDSYAYLYLPNALAPAFVK